MLNAMIEKAAQYSKIELIYAAIEANVLGFDTAIEGGEVGFTGTVLKRDFTSFVSICMVTCTDLS
jgi:hypothetical protein